MSEGTIKNRVKSLINRDVLKLEARVNPFALPHRVAAIVGVKLRGGFKRVSLFQLMSKKHAFERPFQKKLLKKPRIFRGVPLS